MSTNELLSSKSIRPSVHRVMIYDYLKSHRTHPTVEDIYEALHKKAPTLSKTTVYNTLELFFLEGLIKKLSIEGGVVHYDAFNEPHGHFLCKSCKKIYDFDVKEDTFPVEDGFLAEAKELYYYGICKDCMNKN